MYTRFGRREDGWVCGVSAAWWEVGGDCITKIPQFCLVFTYRTAALFFILYYSSVAAVSSVCSNGDSNTYVVFLQFSDGDAQPAV
jgi:hypothetical protein